jgi:hypothetical protein
VIALRSEAERRGAAAACGVRRPDVALWESGYAAEARRSLLLVAQTLGDALETVRPFIDPLLAGTAGGAWDPAARRWL